MDTKFSKFEIRFTKLKKALENLENRISLLENNEIEIYKSALEESVIQCHEIAIELLWKTIQDYILEQDKSIQINYSKETIRFALKSNLIEDKNIGYVLIEAIDNRNKSSHEYWNESELETYINDIIERYYPAMDYVVERLRGN
ncbi:MAG: nucleotidyltransferase substrate binding protein [Lachnospirales bacterium]